MKSTLSVILKVNWLIFSFLVLLKQARSEPFPADIWIQILRQMNPGSAISLSLVDQSHNKIFDSDPLLRNEKLKAIARYELVDSVVTSDYYEKSPDGMRFAYLANGGKTIKVWMGPKIEHKTFVGHENKISSLKFSPNGKLLVSSAVDIDNKLDQTLRIWDVEREVEIIKFDVFQSGYSDDASTAPWTFSPDGKYFAYSTEKEPPQVTQPASSRIRKYRQIEIWDVETWTKLHTLDPKCTSVKFITFSPNEKLFVSHCFGQKNISIWDVESGNLSKNLLCSGIDEKKEGCDSISFSPDSKFLTSKFWRRGHGDMGVRMWELESGTEFNIFEDPEFHVKNLIFSQDSSLLIFTGESKSGKNVIQTWDVETRTPILQNDSLKSPYLGTLSPDGKLFATGGWTFGICEMETAKEIKMLESFHCVFKSSFLPNQKLIVTHSHDDTIRIWDTETGKQVSTFGQGSGVSHGSFFISSDGRYIFYSSAFSRKIEVRKRVSYLTDL
jgi:WD40 repeat protein